VLNRSNARICWRVRRYSSTEGVVVLVTGAVLCLVAYRLMVRIGRLPDERRVLS
jgi:tight adherence protein B